MNYCRISLKPVRAVRHKYAHYRDEDYRALFGSLAVAPQLDFARDEFRREAALVQERMSISGVQEKISARIENDRLRPVAEGGTFLLKPSPRDFPHAAENEHLGMCISRLLGIRTAECGLIPFAESDDGPGPLAYVTKRFDRTPDGTKLHQEDFLQLLGAAPQSNAKYETSYEAAAGVLKEATDGRLGELLEYFRRIVHAHLVGNDDMHMKNLSVQRVEAVGRHKSYYRLSPHYDALSSAIYDVGFGSFFACDLFEDSEGTAFEKYGYYTGADFVDFGRRIGLNEVATTKFIRSVTDKADELRKLVSVSHLPEDDRAKVEAIVEDRLHALGRL